MILVRDNENFERDEVVFIDSQNIFFKVEILPKMSIVDAWKILKLKKKELHENSCLFMKYNLKEELKQPIRQRIFQQITIKNTQLVNNLYGICPIEIVIAKFCSAIYPQINEDLWLFILEYPKNKIKIVAGFCGYIASSRVINSIDTEDIIVEIQNTVRFIRRVNTFNKIHVISNLKNLEKYDFYKFHCLYEKKCLNQFSIKTNDIHEALMKFAEKFDLFKPYLFKKRMYASNKKIKNIFIALFAMSSLFFCFYSNFRSNADYCCELDQIISGLYKEISIIFNKSNLDSKFFLKLEEVKSPLIGLRKIRNEISNDLTINKIVWSPEKVNITTKNSEISPEDFGDLKVNIHDKKNDKSFGLVYPESENADNSEKTVEIKL